MPIVINGTGTITGISAGGLPDDSITTADIADSAVTDAKITALTSSKLTGDLPAIDGSALTGIVTGLTASAFSQNQNGYITLSNGLIIQWGRQSSLSNGTTTNVNFPITFPNACWAVGASWGVQTSGTWHSAFPSINTTRFTAHNVSGSTQSCWFVAVGK